MSKPEDFKFDSRVRDRLLRNRVLSTADVQRHLEQLPDLEGEYEVLSDTPQPAVAPPRSEVTEEPIVFDGIRRLQALGEVSAPAPARYAAPAPAPVSSSGLPAYREPEPRGLGTPLRSALMESEISGVGAGAVSAALGAMAAEARGAVMFGAPPVAIPQVVSPSVPQAPAPTAPSEPPPATPVTLRSEASPPPDAARADADERDDGAVDPSNAVADEDEDEDEDDRASDEDEDDLDDEDSDDEDSDSDDDDDDVVDAAGSDPDNEEPA
jgi:hypothetical protein